MKTNYLPVLLVLCCFSITSFGQFDKFDLEKYKNPFYKRQQLDLSLYLNGNSNSYEPTNVVNPFKSIRSNFTGNFSGTYNAVFNSSKKQSSWLVNLSDYPYFSNQKNENSDSSYTKFKDKTNQISMNIQNSTRYYFANLTFFEFRFNGNASIAANNNTWNYYRIGTNAFLNNSENKTTDKQLSGELSLRLGHGRIEFLEDARLAVYILDDLSKHNRLSRIPTDEEILEFAKIITQVKNKRFFDTRIRKIEEITKADSFLVASNLINKNDAAYFTTLNDNWVNAAGPARASGFRYSIGISPSGKWNYSNDWYSYFSSVYTDSKNDYTKIGISGDLQFDYSKPLSLKWQFDGGLNLKYSLYNVNGNINNNLLNSLSYSSKEHYNEFVGNLSVGFGFYPNSRTSFNSSVGLLYRNSNDKVIDPNLVQNKGNYQNISPVFSLNGYYFISERLRLQASYSVSYSNAKRDEPYDYLYLQMNSSNSKNFNQNFTINLSYAFF